MAASKRVNSKKREDTPKKGHDAKTVQAVQIAQPVKKISPKVITLGLMLAVLILFLGMRLLYEPQNINYQNTTTPEPKINANSSFASSPTDSAISRLGPLDHTFTFEEVFKRMREIDKSQSTDFRKESLRNNLLPLNRIDPLIAGFKQLRDDLNRSTPNNESVYWISLVEGRLDMLESQRYFNLALAYGRSGLFTKNITDSCSRQKTILDAAFLYNQTALKGGRAMNRFDETLTQEVTWPILGINDKKMAFFGGDTRDIGGLAFNNVEAVRIKCLGLPSGDIPTMGEALENTKG